MTKINRTHALALLTAVILASGCLSTADKQAYYDAQIKALQEAKPLVQIIAQPGQAISGLASLTVYAPAAAAGGMQQLSDPYANVLVNGLGVVGTVAGVYFGGQAAVGLATAVGNSAGHNSNGWSFNPSNQAGVVYGSPGSTGNSNPAPVVVVPAASASGTPAQ